MFKKMMLTAALSLACLVAPAASQVASETVVTGLDRPVRLVAPPGDQRLFVVERVGTILVFDQSGAFRDTFLDVRAQTTTTGERGLLGLAFPPDYAATGRCYVSFTGSLGESRLVRYLVSANPDRVDPASAYVVLAVGQPFSNHNGGHIEFGPDGMLYFGLGDGGGEGDPDNYAQNDVSLLGKMLRLDVSGPGGYAIPPDNPFVGQAPLDLIWAKGLRNPWCWCFDRLTGDLYIADVGQDLIEEIDVQPAGSPGGENYGWRLMEGSACYDPPTGCEQPGLVLPVFEYTHGGTPFRCSITGGYVYRGAAIPQLDGYYFFADFCSAQVWSIAWNAQDGATRYREWTGRVAPAGGFSGIAGFGQDAAGELYVLDFYNGSVHRLIPDPSAVPAAPEPVLAQNVPNPFNPSTSIRFAADPEAGPVALRVYDLAGRLVRTLFAGPAPAGERTVNWDGTDADARPVAAGVYHYVLSQGDRSVARKMVLLE